MIKQSLDDRKGEDVASNALRCKQRYGTYRGAQSGEGAMLRLQPVAPIGERGTSTNYASIVGQNG